MTNEKNTARATDPNDLERQILDPNIAKTEAEWWAKRRIEELEREVDKWREASRVKHLEAIEWAGKHQLLDEHCNALQIEQLRARIADLISEVTKADNALSEGDRNKALIGVRMSATAASLVEQAIAATQAQSLDERKGLK